VPVNYKYLLFPCLLLHLVCAGQNASKNAIVLEGSYRGKNLYIQNPYGSGDPGFCTERVIVNEKEIAFENAGAYEIHLDSLGLKFGDPIRIVIHHKDDCKPKVLNPVIDSAQYFNFKDVAVSGDSLLKWTTTYEEGTMPFIIEQYRWNKWIKVGEVNSKGVAKENSYEFQLRPHSGKNMVRIRRLVGPIKYTVSESISFTSNTKEISCQVDKKNKQIQFSAETDYELYSQYGHLLKRGKGKTINCSELKKGSYFLNYDNTINEFAFY
jgi:hypothetical protein